MCKQSKLPYQLLYSFLSVRHRHSCCLTSVALVGEVGVVDGVALRLELVALVEIAFVGMKLLELVKIVLAEFVLVQIVG